MLETLTLMHSELDSITIHITSAQSSSDKTQTRHTGTITIGITRQINKMNENVLTETDILARGLSLDSILLNYIIP